MRIRFTAGDIEITEGGRMLTEDAASASAGAGSGAGSGADGAVGEVRPWYDGGILEVFSPPRHGGHGHLPS